MSTLSLAGVVLLVGGLGIAIFASQQSTENRSHASGPAVNDVVGEGDLQTTSGNTVYPGSPGAPANITIIPGYTYTVQISGTYQYQYQRPTGTDAGWMTDAQWDDWQQSGKNECYCRPIGHSKVDFNGAQVNSDDYQNQSSPSHTYSYTWPATTTNLQLLVEDLQYHDNRGTLHYKVIVKSVPDAAPAAPTNLTAHADSTTQITLNWTASLDADVAGYKIFRSDKTDGPITTVSGTTTTYQDTNLTPNTQYTYYVVAFDAAGNNSGKSNDASATTASPAPESTIFNFTLFLHGIGKGGDNVLDNDPNHDPNTNVGTVPPSLLHLQRSVTVEVRNPTDNTLILTKNDAIATYNTQAGNFTISNLDMGTTLTSKIYKVVVITQSLRGKTTTDITAGAPNTIPPIRLVNGDANGDGILNILDYHLISGCVADPDFGQTATDCDDTRAAEANIDDDTKGVTIYDLSLLIREFSVQSL